MFTRQNTHPCKNWQLILWLALAPVIVSAYTIASTDIPQTDPLLGTLAPPINPWIDDFPISLFPALLLGCTGWLSTFIPAHLRFRTFHSALKWLIMGTLITITLVLLWFSVVFMHLRIVLKYWYEPMIGSPTPKSWVPTFGAIWVVGTLVLGIPLWRSAWWNSQVLSE